MKGLYTAAFNEVFEKYFSPSVLKHLGFFHKITDLIPDTPETEKLKFLLRSSILSYVEIIKKNNGKFYERDYLELIGSLFLENGSDNDDFLDKLLDEKIAFLGDMEKAIQQCIYKSFPEEDWKEHFDYWNHEIRWLKRNDQMNKKASDSIVKIFQSQFMNRPERSFED